MRAISSHRFAISNKAALVCSSEAEAAIASAQQQAMPVVGFLNNASATTFARFAAAFRYSASSAVQTSKRECDGEKADIARCQGGSSDGSERVGSWTPFDHQ